MPEIDTLSPKQLLVMDWWLKPEFKNKYFLLADGSVRSGKTLSLSISFLTWCFQNFRHAKFIIAGQSVSSIRQNILDSLIDFAKRVGYFVHQDRNNNTVIFRLGDNWNEFILFGDPNKSAKDHVAGISTSGCLLDEATRMDEPFVNMVTSHCNVKRKNDDGVVISRPKVWMDCNPSVPVHFIKTEWLDKTKEKNGLNIHFRLTDNPSLDKNQIKQYESFYSGVFYRRDILGEWATSDALVFNTFDNKSQVINYQQFLKMTKDHHLTYFVGQDFGFEHFNSIVLMAADENNNNYVIKEITDQHKLMSVHIHTIQRIYDRYGKIPVYCDSANPDKIQSLRDAGINAQNADKRVMPGVEYLCGLINTHHFYVVGENTNHLLNDIYKFHWNPKTGKPQTSSGNDDDYDATDAARYGGFTHYQAVMNKRSHPSMKEQYNAVQSLGLIR